MNVFENIDKTLIIDADSLVFFACYKAEKDTLSEEFYEVGGREKDIVLLATLYAKNHIQEMQDSTGCESVECYFTTGRKSFRYEVDPTYKQNREGGQPLIGLSEVKKALHELYPGDICEDIEADDIVVLRGKQRHTIIAAIDKDVLSQTVGTHYNYKRNEWVTTSKKDAEKFLWEQMIVGDATDGIYGIEGMGKVKAKKFLDSLQPQEYKKAVLELYKSNGKSKSEFLSNWNLLDMHLLQKDMTIKLHTMEELK